MLPICANNPMFMHVQAQNATFVLSCGTTTLDFLREFESAPWFARVYLFGGARGCRLTMLQSQEPLLCWWSTRSSFGGIGFFPGTSRREPWAEFVKRCLIWIMLRLISRHVVCNARAGHFTHALSKNWRQRPDIFCLVSRAAWFWKACRLREVRFKDPRSNFLHRMGGLAPRMKVVSCDKVSKLGCALHFVLKGWESHFVFFQRFGSWKTF